MKLTKKTILWIFLILNISFVLGTEFVYYDSFKDMNFNEQIQDNYVSEQKSFITEIEKNNASAYCLNWCGYLDSHVVSNDAGRLKSVFSHSGTTNAYKGFFYRRNLTQNYLIDSNFSLEFDYNSVKSYSGGFVAYWLHIGGYSFSLDLINPSCGNNDYLIHDGTNQHLIINYNNISEDCPSMLGTRINVTDLYVFANSLNPSGTFYLDNFSINIDNELPYFNVTLDNTNICIPKDTSQIKLNFTIDSKDIENDTIYYSTSVLDYLLRYDIYEEKGTYAFLNSNRFVSNYSYTTDYQDSQLWFTNYYNNKPYVALGSIDNNPKIITEIGVDSWSYVFDSVLNGDIFSSYYLAFPVNNTYMFVEYLDSLGNSISTITYNYTDYQNMTVYVDNVLVYNEYQDKFTSTIDNNIITTILFYNNTYITFDFDNSYSENNYQYNYNKSYSDISQIKFNTIDTYEDIFYNNNEVWLLDYLNVRGYNYVPFLSFSSTKPSHIFVNSSGIGVLSLYVTDSLHLTSNEYRQELIYFNIEQCGEYPELNPTLKETTKGIKDINMLICSTINVVGDSLKSGFGQSYTLNFCKFLVVLFTVIVITLSAIFSIGFVSRISVPLGIGSFCILLGLGMILVNFIIEVGTGYVASAVLSFAIGVGSLLLGLFNSGN